ncbi:hypothetical protein GIB67_014365 [Kingdonia uniflora]|uniref:Fe2OG dioxygenase domain-containing protein n=1 Tax=Kingdonia uniflora TaxID=39325 RepID=A0A7J7NTA0_9MAGN|nr:hypothetical protein GIB67_014365 [Kingdonia uniflora]
MSSYPPLFLPTNLLIQTDNSGNSSQDLDLLPVIDLQNLNPSDIGEVCRDWGVFRLINHGIPETLSNQLHEETKKLFDLPFETKKDICAEANIPYFWGTPALNSVNAAMLTKNVNWVEGFSVVLDQLQLIQMEHPALFSFRSLLEEHGQHMARLSRNIFKAMVTDLGLDLTLTEPYLSKSTGLIRVYRYPHCSETEKVLGLDAHTDSSVLSILSQDNIGGLQILKDDAWFNIKPIPNTLIVNLGDMSQAISDDAYRSVTHRVKVNKCEQRISICYFVFPVEDTVIRSSKYKPFTNQEFRSQVQEDIKTTGTKIGLPRFKLGH